MRLKERLIERIALDGPMTVAEFMQACLHDPADGYYATRPALGEDGDFITAPLISQMFGELIGVWAIHVWRALGSPARFRLIEVGPGDGTLMGDMLRAARLDPSFQLAMDIWLVETSEPLKQVQSWKLSGARPRWTDRLSEVPRGAPDHPDRQRTARLPARPAVRPDAGRLGRADGRRRGRRPGLWTAPRAVAGPGGAGGRGRRTVRRPGGLRGGGGGAADPSRRRGGAVDRLWRRRAWVRRHPSGAEAARQGRRAGNRRRGGPHRPCRLSRL